MTDKEKLVGDVFETLRLLATRSFPIECSCGAIYYTLDEFLAQTPKPEREHGLFDPTEYDDRTIANLLRNCPNCGSSLLAVFTERRDMSARGDKLRTLFANVLDLLVRHGVEMTAARDELRRILAGQESPFLREHLLGRDDDAIRAFLQELQG